MVKQISLDAWQIQHLTDLLEKGSKIVAKTPIDLLFLYRQTLEEEDESYEEIVCTLNQRICN